MSGPNFTVCLLALCVFFAVKNRTNVCLCKLFNPYRYSVPAILTVCNTVFCIYWFHISLSVNTDCFHEQH
jgi:hypothetical protein